MSCIHFAFLEQTSKDQLCHLQDEVIPSVSLQTPETPTLLQSRKFETFKSRKKSTVTYCQQIVSVLVKILKSGTYQNFDVYATIQRTQCLKHMVAIEPMLDPEILQEVIKQ
jgi:hypothetical protein